MRALFSNQQSIRNKIIVLIMGISALALIFTLVPFILYDRVSFKQKMITDLETLGEIISANSVAALTFLRCRQRLSHTGGLESGKTYRRRRSLRSRGDLVHRLPPG